MSDPKEIIKAALPEAMKAGDPNAFIGSEVVGADDDEVFNRTIDGCFNLDTVALAILSALEAEGWKLIRREVTVEMNCAAWKLVRDRWPQGQLLGPGPCFREAMQAMIDAAPTWGERGMSRDEEVAALRIAVIDQWLSNHFEHCGHRPPWQHSGMCHWPLPEIIARLPEDEIRAIMYALPGGKDG